MLMTRCSTHSKHKCQNVSDVWKHLLYILFVWKSCSGYFKWNRSLATSEIWAFI